MEDKNILNEKFTIELTGAEIVLVIDCMKNTLIDINRFLGNSKTEKDFARMGVNIAQKLMKAMGEGKKNV